MNKFPYSDAVNERYQKLIETDLREGSKTLCLLCLLLFPVFSVVDFYTQREFFFELTLIRHSTAAIYLVIYILMRLDKISLQPQSTIFLMLILAALSISLMCVITGGLTSRYYAGLNLVILAAVLIFPGGTKRLVGAIVSILGIYLFAVSWGNTASETTIYFINNMGFLTSTAVIGIASSLMTERLRKQSFLRFEELEQTKGLLQGELIGHQGNIEALTRQLIERKIELQKAFEMMTAAREETHQALKLREEFISLASHELKTPLTSLKLQTELARRKLEGKPNLSSFDPYRLLETYDSQIKRLTRIVDDMLDISRIKKGKLELELMPVDLKKLVENLVNRFEEKFSGEGIDITVTGEEVTGTWDAYRLEQVVLNLINNAIKYGQGKPVEINVRKDKSKGFLSVIDLGIGVAEGSQIKIFQRFERAVSSREFSGLGLGLYISKMIIEAHGGQITLCSQEGKGSTFTVELPLSR